MKYIAFVVLCFVIPTSWCQHAGDLRLALGGPNSGRLEVFINGSWGTVDKNSFGEAIGRVACAKLGFQNTTGCQMEPDRNYGSGDDEIGGLGNPICNGTERSLSDCQRFPWNMIHCQPTDEISIRCMGNLTMPPPPPGNATDSFVRLVGGNDTNSGRLEIFLNGTWAPVCHPGGNVHSIIAAVACRTLGYSNGGEPFNASEAQVPQWLRGVHCNGNETSLFDCLHEVPQEADHEDDLWLSCVPEGTQCPAPSPTSPSSRPPAPSTRLSTRPPITTRKPTTTTVKVQRKLCNQSKFFAKNRGQCLKLLCRQKGYAKSHSKACRNA